MRRRIISTDEPDRGDIVLGWLTRLSVTLALLGLVGFDLISLAAGRFQVQDHASTAALAAQTSWHDTKNVQASYDAGLKALADAGAAQDQIDPNTFSVGPDGTVTLTVTHRVATLLVERIGPTRSWAVERATASSPPVR